MKTAAGAFLNWLTAACAILVLATGLLIPGCQRTDWDQPATAGALRCPDFPGLPPIRESQLSHVPRPEPPDDFTALVGVSEGDAPNQRLLGWLGHLDPERSDSLGRRIDEAAIRQLEGGAEIFDCGPYVIDEKLRRALSSAPRLTWLRSGRKTKAVDLGWICALSMLRGLSLHEAQLEQADLSLLGKLGELSWLHLDSAHLPSGDSQPLPPLPKLEVLSMRYCTGVADNYVPTAGQYPNLKAVCFANTGITDIGVRQLVAANPKLRYLHLYGCRGVTGHSAAEIAKLNDLRYIDVGDTPLEQDLCANWSGGQGLPRLQVLIPYCYIGIGD